MKDVPFTVLETPFSPPVPFSAAGDPFDVLPQALPATMPQRFYAVDPFADSRSVEDFVYSGVFVTMLCSLLGWSLLYPREIITAVAVAIYSVGDGIVTMFKTLS